MIINDQEVAWAYLLSPEFELSNSAGKPLTGGWIEVYIHGTRTKYYCASDFDGTLHPFKIPLDSLGSNIVLASPANAYDVYVYNKFGSLTMSRYNVQPKLGAGEIVHDEITVTSNDGTVNVEASGNTNYDLSIADTVSAVSSLQDAVSGLDIRVQDLETAVTGIEESLDGKKDLQAPYSASGTNVQTITKIAQDEQGVMTVEYSDIQAQNPLTPGQYVTIDDDVISVTGLQPEGDYLVSGDLDSYATKDYVTAYVEEHAGDDQVQSDWAQTDSEAVDYIKNKPAEKVLVAGDHIDITSTVSSVEISAEGFATEDYVVDYVDSVISGIDPVDIISSDGTIVVSSTVSGSVKVFDLSVSGGQPVYFRGGETWVPVSGTTADFSTVKKFDGTIVPSDTVSGTVPLEDGLWAWDAIVDIYVSGHVNELVKCGIKGQAVGNGYDPDSETELLIDSTRPGVINSFTLTGLSRGGSNAHLAFTFTRENSSTSTMWVRMRRLSVYQVKGPGVSQSGGGGDYEAGYGIIINNNVISVNSALIPDIETVTNMIDASIDGLATEDYVTGYVESQVSGLQPAGDYLVPSDLDDYATHDEVNTVSGAIVNLIPDTSDFATHDEVNTVSGAIIADVNNVSGTIVSLIPDVSDYATHDEVNTVSGAIVSLIPSVEITPALASGTKIAEYSIDGVSGELFAPEGGGSSTVYVDIHTGLKGDGSQSDPIAINYDTDTLSTAQGTETITFTSGTGGYATIPGSSAMTSYMGNHTVSITFQGITPVTQYRSPVKLTLSRADGQGGDLYLNVSSNIAANGTMCVVTFNIRNDIADWSPGTWNPSKDWNLWLYLVDDEATYPQIPYGYATSEVPGDNYKLTVRDPVPSHSYSDRNKVLTVNSSNNTLYWNTVRSVPGHGFNDTGKVLTAGSNASTETWKEIEIVVADGSPIIGNGSAGEPLNLNIDNDTLAVSSITDNNLPMVGGHAQIYANTTLSRYIASNNITFTITGITPTSSSRTVLFSFTGGNTGSRFCAPQIVSGGTIPAGASSFSITVSASNYYEWSDPYSSAYDWHIDLSEDDGETWPAITYTGCSHNGPAASTNVLMVKNPVPSSTSSDENKVLTVNSSGTPEWQPAQGGGTTYTAGNMISLANDAIAVSTTAGITDIRMVATLPASPVSSVLYLIPEV